MSQPHNVPDQLLRSTDHGRSTTHSPRLRIGPLFHRAMTDERKAVEVWKEFIRLRNLELLSTEPLPYPYETFTSKLRCNGHGELSLEDLPTLCRALRAAGIDPEPILHIIFAACTTVDHVCDGSLIDEILGMIDRLGKISATVRDSNLRALTTSELRALLQNVGTLQEYLLHAQAELTTALRA